MGHRIEKFPGDKKSVSYFWQLNRREHFLKVLVCGRPQPPINGSLSEFISEHYWGYAKQRDGSTMEYRVEHPRWQIWETRTAELRCDAANLYGENFHETFNGSLATAFLADGSEVKVYQGVKLTV
jgi:hypothetical protein